LTDDYLRTRLKIKPHSLKLSYSLLPMLLTITPTQNDDLASKLEHAINTKTKPLGSLGVLEAVAHRLGMVQATTRPTLDRCTLWVFAADHGVVAQGVSAYPQDVTWQMVENYLAGGAAVNVFARCNTMDLNVVDAGIAHEFGQRPKLFNRKIAAGTADFSQVPAMTQAQCDQALAAGIALMKDCDSPAVAFGEMGIGNTTAASALLAYYAKLPAAQCVGAGTGLDAQGISHKARVIQAAIALHGAAIDQSSNPAIAALQHLGGFEIAMMAGAMLGAAAQRKVMVIDGFIVSSALLVAAHINPTVLDYCVLAHTSAEAGHAALLKILMGMDPALPPALLGLGLRLGEGTGAALAWPLVKAAAHMLSDMASFESASVSAAH
jgi:nicotinate-nucleotide--dimethylbenzimidazole phosphoribosyltransferase